MVQAPAVAAGSVKVYQIRDLPGRLMPCDPAKNIYGSMYHVREPQSMELGLSVPDFFQCSRTWKTKLLSLLASTLCWEWA